MYLVNPEAKLTAENSAPLQLLKRHTSPVKTDLLFGLQDERSNERITRPVCLTKAQDECHVFGQIWAGTNHDVVG
jgi:hypothetical protein